MTSNSLPPESTCPASGPRFIEKIQQHPRRAIGLGALGLLLLVGVPVMQTRLASPRVEAAKVDQATVLPVETLTVEAVDRYEVARTYTGEIAALRTSELGFARSGQLVEVYLQEGDRVAAGAPIARLDTRNLQTQRQQLEAEKARAMAQLAELETGPRAEDIAAAAAAVRDLEQQLALQETQRSRREFLYEEGAISKEELDEFAFGEGALQARLDQSQSNLEELQNGTRQEQLDAQRALIQQLDASIADLDVTISKSTINAPFDGIVSTRQVDEGTVVNAGQSVLRLVENAAPEARIGMPTDIANQLQAGTSQMLRLGAETYSATVDSVLPEVDPETRTQTVVFRLEPAAIPSISPGQTVRAELIETIPTDGVWLPTEALTQGIRGLWNCYVLTPSDEGNPDTYEVQPQAVEILHQEGDRALVRGTLQPGDQIVANGTHRLVPGQQVRLAN
ncbi:MAG: efflux RND transporter periplasmic adaptor subunit [Leptolyngbya sp. SIO1E4]|nr:efflux RND transporter periplasmic adaptor subunit [Leptolyngbya sp. SIO1E4]